MAENIAQYNSEHAEMDLIVFFLFSAQWLLILEGHFRWYFTGDIFMRKRS